MPKQNLKQNRNPSPKHPRDTQQRSAMMTPPTEPYLPTGAAVVDGNGDRIGTIRAVYPHYVAVAASGAPPDAYRVPFRAIARVTDDTVTLSVPVTALDRMTPEEVSALGLPHHGGEAPAGTGGPGPAEAAAGETLGAQQIGDGQPGGLPPDEARNLRRALFDAEADAGVGFGEHAEQQG